MRLEDGDIALRPYTADDVPAITAACQDPEIPRWTSVPSPYTEEDARRFVAGPEDHHAFAVVDAKTDELLGSVGFGLEEHGRAGFGYWTRREARGRDVASRALRLLTRWAAPRARPRPPAAHRRAGERRLPAGRREGRLSAGGAPALVPRAQGHPPRRLPVRAAPRGSLSRTRAPGPPRATTHF